ncbi:MAG: hypothetical protein FWD57_16355 [Polyangiaceae bacterium]|nr:hypothetical protein [Polyangiaceae bacterium]
MHRSVENAVPLTQHPVRDASLGSLAAISGIGRDPRGYGLMRTLGLSQGLFHFRIVISALSFLGLSEGLFYIRYNKWDNAKWYVVE